MIGLIVTGAALVGGFVIARDFVRRRLRYVDAVRRPSAPIVAGIAAAAVALPVFLVILPAGALADMVDRRRFLLVTQGWMVLASGALAALLVT